MLYNINNNNYISVRYTTVDDALSLNLLQGSLYLSKLLITKLYLFTCICMSCMVNPINLIIPINVNIAILPIMGVIN